MKTLYLYLTRQVLATLGMTVFVFTLVLLLGNVLKQILTLIVQHPGLAVHAILLLIPYVLAFSLPIGMLTAALLVFGRLSADQELTAARASGLSLVSLVAPILALSVVVSAFCAWLNFDLAPASRVAYKALLDQAAQNSPGIIIRPNTYTPFGKYVFFALRSDGTNLEDVRILEWNSSNQLVRTATAKSAEIAIDKTNGEIVLNMHGMTSQSRENGGWVPSLEGDDYPLRTTNSFFNKTLNSAISIDDMTFRQLRQKLAQLEVGAAPLLPSNPTPEQIEQARRSQHSVTKDLTMPVLVFLNQQVAFSFACIGFTLIGIPLAIRAHRRETSVGVAVALVLVLIYYSFMVLGQAWLNHPERYPCLIVWLPNFIFQAVGLVLLWNLNRKVG